MHMCVHNYVCISATYEVYHLLRYMGTKAGADIVFTTNTGE